MKVIGSKLVIEVDLSEISARAGPARRRSLPRRTAMSMSRSTTARSAVWASSCIRKARRAKT